MDTRLDRRSALRPLQLVPASDALELLFQRCRTLLRAELLPRLEVLALLPALGHEPREVLRVLVAARRRVGEVALRLRGGLLALRLGDGVAPARLRGAPSIWSTRSWICISKACFAPISSFSSVLRSS